MDLASERLADCVPSLDWVLLLAARVATAASWADPVGELAAVAGVTANSVMDLRSRQIVHLSSGSVYETLTGDLSPRRILAPRLPYGIAKVAGELLLASYADAPYWNVRFFGAFGPEEPRFKLARRLVDVFLRGDRQFTIQGDGSNIIDPMFIEDAVRELTSLLTTPGQCRTVDLTQGEGLTVREFVSVAYENVHSAASEGELVIDYEGEAHEQMRGRARSDPEVFGSGDQRLTIAAGFRRYASAIASGQALPSSARQAYSRQR